VGFRHLFQFGALILYNANYLFSFKFCPVPALNCYACPLASFACPIGSLQHFMVLRRIPFFLIGFFFIVGGTIGRMVCGWACPAGWLQELLFKLPGTKIKIRNRLLPKLRYIVLLILVLLLPFITGEAWFSRFCFMGTLQAGLPLALTDTGIREMIGLLFYLKLVITGLLLLAFVLIKRPFCRFLCPLGAIWGGFNRFSFLQMSVEDSCVQCGECQNICPVDIKIYEDPNSPECIRCLECTSCAKVKLKKGKEKAKKGEV